MPLMIPEAFAIQDKGDFKLAYNITENYTEFESWIKSTQYFESQVEWLNEKFRLPHDVIVGVAECGESNAYYYPKVFDPEQKRSFIVYCYELIADHFVNMEWLRLHGYEYAPDVFCGPVEPNCTKFNPTVEDRVLNVIDSVFYHEFGHAVIDLYDLPIPTAREDAADSLSSYVLLEFSDANTGNDAIRDAAWDYMVATINGNIGDFADVHSTNPQRFFNLACHAYGKDPSLNSDLITSGLLPEYRAKGCPYEYQELVSSWKENLKPFLQNDLPLIHNNIL